MKPVVYGADREKTILLLHGGGLSWWNYREAAELLQGEYRVILPVLDGHAGSGRHFTSIEDNASELLRFVDRELDGRLLLLGGLSLGAQVAIEMLARRKDLCPHALIESASVIPDRLTAALVGPAFGSSYGLIRNRSFARVQAASLHIPEALFEEYFRDTCAIAKEDLVAFMKASTAYALKDGLRDCPARVRVYAGEKETRGILRSARLLADAFPDAALHILPGMTHGDFSLNRAADYSAAIREMLGE